MQLHLFTNTRHLSPLTLVRAALDTHVQSYLCYSGTTIIKPPNHQIKSSHIFLLRNKQSAPPHRDLWGLHLFNQEHPLSNHHQIKCSHIFLLRNKNQHLSTSSRQRPFDYAQGSALSAMLKAAPLDFSLGSA
jgi:hypothetical protein